MPIPRWPKGTEQWESFEQADKAYKEFGWSKEIIFERVNYNQNMRTWIASVYRASSSKFPCDCGTGSEFVYLTRMPTGIMMTCVICRHTHGPLSYYDSKNKRDLIVLLSQRAITVKDALSIIKKSGQMMPAKLDPKGSVYSHAKKLLDLRIEQR